jgi:phage terminase small subunit
VSGKGAINKQKATEICAEMLWAGKTRPDILQLFAKSYSASVRAIDGYIKEARTVNEKRKAAMNTLQAEKDKEEIEAIAKELGLTRRSQLAELKKVGYMDPRKLYHDDGSPKEISELDDETAGAIAGIETLEERDPLTKKVIGTTKKIKKEPKLAALTEINRMMGWVTPATAKVEVDEPGGKGQPAKKISVTLNLS